MVENREYYRSERFIWDNLKVQAAAGIVSLYKTWKIAGKVQPFLMAWPSETILDDNGLPMQGACLYELPDDHQQWAESMRKFASKTKAYALLLVEQKPKEVLVILESHHGTRSWSIPITVSGDIRTLGTAVVKEDTHKIGLLWKPRARAS